MAAREIRIERRGKAGLDAAEKLYVTRDADGNRLIPEPTGEALFETLTAPLAAAAASTQEIGEQVAQNAAEKIAEVDAAIAAIPEAQEQLQALADILVPSGATATFRDPDNLMLLGDML